jgi:hypothetical protein
MPSVVKIDTCGAGAGGSDDDHVHSYDNDYHDGLDDDQGDKHAKFLSNLAAGARGLDLRERLSLLLHVRTPRLDRLHNTSGL